MIIVMRDVQRRHLIEHVANGTSDSESTVYGGHFLNYIARRVHHNWLSLLGRAVVGRNKIIIIVVVVRFLLWDFLLVFFLILIDSSFRFGFLMRTIETRRGNEYDKQNTHLFLSIRCQSTNTFTIFSDCWFDLIGDLKVCFRWWLIK